MATGKSEKLKENAPGLLITVVRKLLFSSDVGEREAEKARLQKQFLESDHRLDGLVADHIADLTLVSQTFNSVSARLSASRERIHAIRDNLQSCKNLLHCKRDELRRLWIEGVEMKTVHSALDSVERVINASERLPTLIASRSYLTATELVVQSLALLDSELADVDALQQTKVDLNSKKEELYEMLMDELHRQLYIRPTSVIFRGFQRTGSTRGSLERSLAGYFKTSVGVSKNAASDDDVALKLLMDADISEILSSSRPAMDLSNPDSNPVGFISILVESLANLHRLPEAIDVLRSRIGPGLNAFIQRASQHVADGACIEDNTAVVGPIQPQLLLELLLLVFCQARVIAHTHNVILANMQRVKNSTSTVGDICLYNSIEIWSEIQSVLKSLLTDYLDIHNTINGCQSMTTVSLDDSAVDITSYFLRKRAGNTKKGMSIVNGGEIVRSRGSTSIVYVCRRSAANITTIYNPMQKFLQDIANETNTSIGSLSLQIFIREFVCNMYLDQVRNSIESNIAQVTKGFDVQRSLIDMHSQRELGVFKPLLKSTVVVARNVQELCGLMCDLPDYADQFLNMICKILQDYLDTCHIAYNDLVSGYSDIKKVISANWVKDDDINRFLRSLPNWSNLKAVTVAGVGQLTVEDDVEDQMSEEEHHMMNLKESAILTSNLSTSDSRVSNNEIITDITLLRALGNLCESTEWFAQRIDEFATSLCSGGQVYMLLLSDSSTTTDSATEHSNTPHVVTASESTITTLRSLSRHFVDISELCVLVLHLEVRMHSFHHLLAISHGQHSDYHGVIDKMEPDENVIRLNKDLMAIEEAMQQSVQHRKFRYIFEGLGHLVSTILINSAQFLRRINENGIKKILVISSIFSNSACQVDVDLQCFFLQEVWKLKCLTNITANRESDLDHARQYYELLYLPADDIMKAIVDKGRQFTEHEYTILLSLSHRSEYGSKEDELTARLQKFRTILSENTM